MASRPSNETGPQYPIESVDRALRLLLMFQDQPSIRIVDVAKVLGVAPSTVHRTLAMLLEYGFVKKDDGSRAYVMGEVLVDLGIRALSGWDISDRVRPFMTEAVVRLHETIELGVLRGREVLFIAEVEGEQMVHVRSSLGRRVPAFSSSIGRVHLAEYTAPQLGSLYPNSPIRDADSGRSMTKSALEKTLAEVREKGYATNRPFDDAGFLSIAVPVRRGGRVVAGLGVALPTQRLEADWEERATTELTETAKRIELSFEEDDAS
ncbi:IclR family transcriptional regulator [Nocardioides sp. AN3]